jgi:hydrogenase nickel incorporation protein HypA/HybF
MHEMSIAQSIVDIARDYAAKENALIVREIELCIGTMAGIEFESLEFALDVCKRGGILEEAKITITKIKAMGKCLDCSSDFEVVQMFDPCPNCNSFSTQLISGKELQVKSLLVD